MSKYITKKVIEEYTEAEGDRKRQKAISRKVYDKICMDADAEYLTMISFGMNKDNIYSESKENVDKFMCGLDDEIKK